MYAKTWSCSIVLENKSILSTYFLLRIRGVDNKKKHLQTTFLGADKETVGTSLVLRLKMYQNKARSIPFIFVIHKVETSQETVIVRRFNPFQANVPILYPLKMPENHGFSGVFRGYKMGTLVWNGLTHFRPMFIFYTPEKI